MINHTWFLKIGQYSAFLINLSDFFSKYDRTGVFNQFEIGKEHAANFQNKMYCKF